MEKAFPEIVKCLFNCEFFCMQTKSTQCTSMANCCCPLWLTSSGGCCS